MARVTCHVCSGEIEAVDLIQHLLLKHAEQWPSLDDIPQESRVDVARRAVKQCWGAEPHGLNFDDVVCGRHLAEAQRQLAISTTRRDDGSEH